MRAPHSPLGDTLHSEARDPAVGLGEKVKVSKTFRPTCFLMYFSISSIVSFLEFFHLSAPSVVKLTFYENKYVECTKMWKFVLVHPDGLFYEEN